MRLKFPIFNQSVPVILVCVIALNQAAAVLAAGPSDANPAPLPNSYDLVPANHRDLNVQLEMLSFEATLYGLPAYLQYQQMWRQTSDTHSTNFTGFNKFFHENELAGPGYASFKVPNTDTLYSTAWLDLNAGPLKITIPATTLNYFTLNIFDIYGNPNNLSTRTIGSNGGRFLFVSPTWRGVTPPDFTLYRASTPHLWILMRVFAQTTDDLAKARDFQTGVVIEPLDGKRRPDLTPVPSPGSGARGMLQVLDYILRADSNLPGEEALVAQFRALGVGGTRPFDPAQLSADNLAAIDAGYRSAMGLIQDSKTQLGQPTGTHWSRVDKGNYGYNYVRRSTINLAGLGANVREENASYTTFEDAEGRKLNGSQSSYALTLMTPPPVNAFWSVTLYDANSFELYANPLKRYLISDRTPGLKKQADGSIRITMQHAPATMGNWLPAPAGPFFVVIRAYLPKPTMLDGRWLPQAIERHDLGSKISDVAPPRD